MIRRKDVKDFFIRSNVEDFGYFDDVVIDILLQDGSSENFAIQLKHKQNIAKKITPCNFENKGDFYIERYFKEFNKLSETKKQQYDFVLYTNLEFNQQFKNEGKIFKISLDRNHREQEFLNTNFSNDNVFYKFETKKDTFDKQTYADFFSKFTLYTSQDDVDTIKKKILSFFPSEENGLLYMDLFRKWHQGKFTDTIINREIVVFHLTHILLSTGMITDRILPNLGNLKLFEEAVRLFNVTIIEDSVGLDYLQKAENSQVVKEESLMRLAKDFKLVERSAKKLIKDIENLLLSYFFRKLLILDSTQVSNQVISQVANFFRNDEEMNFVVFSESFDTTFLQCSVFQNLEDLKRKNEDLFSRIIATSKVLFQGRNISLNEFAITFEEIPHFIGTKEIFNILKNDWILIGENQEPLPAYYINRKLSITVLDLDTVLKCIRDENNIVIIGFHDLDEKQFSKHGIIVMCFNDFMESASSIKYPFVIVAHKEEIADSLETIRKRLPNKNIHHFKKIEDKFFLIKSTNNIFLSNDYTLQKTTCNIENIHHILDGPINIICGGPGMGKTTTMNHLQSIYPNNFWTIGIDLKAHYLFLKNKHSFEDVLKHFLNTEETDVFISKLKEIFLKRKQIVFFFDGLDELDNDSLKNVLHHIKELSENGFRVWISSRQNLQNYLEFVFNSFVTEIVEFTQEEQYKYIAGRLTDKYNKKEIELLLEKFSYNTQVVNNHKFLKIPLQIYIMTEIFLEKKNNVDDLEENMFVLTKMYRHFFEARYKHLINQHKSTNSFVVLRDLDDYLEDYELIALQSIFNSDVLNHLRLDLRRSERFLEKIKKERDPLGIIVKVDNEGKAVFEHVSYAEYFICSYLSSNNLEKAKLLKEQLISDQYKNIFLMFCTLLAENCPLHLAVINKNLPKIEKYINDNVNDVAGQNPFQLVVSLVNCNSENVESAGFNEESNKNKVIMQKLIRKFDPYEKDSLFGMDAFHWAILRRSLYALELILENYGMTREAFVTLKENNYIQNEMIACLSIKWNYPNLLAVALQEANSNLTKNESFLKKVVNYASLATPHIIELLMSYGVQVVNEKLLNKALENDNYELVKHLIANSGKNYQEKDLLNIALKNQSWNVFKFLIEKEWNVNGIMIRNLIEDRQFEIAQIIFDKQPHLDRSSLVPILQEAIEHEDVEMINYLLEIGIDINLKDQTSRQNVLHVAAQSNSAEIVKLLLEKEPEVTEDYEGKTPTAIGILNDNIEIVRLFPVDNGKNSDGQTMLHLASDRGNIKIVNYIYNEINGVNEKDRKGRTPIFYAAKGGHTEVFEFLINCGAHIDDITTDGETLLHSAAMGGSCNIISYLVDKGLDVNAENYNGQTPLNSAIEYKQINAMKYLVNDKTKINSLEKSFLEEAIRRGWLDVIKLIILKHGIGVFDVKLKNANKTALFLAIESNQFEVAEFLLDHNAEVNDFKAFEAAAKKDDTRFLSLLFNKDYRLYRGINSEQKLFDLLVKNGNFEAINVLLLNNARLNIEEIFWKAIDCKKIHTVVLCIEKDVNLVNALSKGGETVLLHVFKTKRNMEMEKLLIRSGANLNCTSRSGETIWKYLNWNDKDLIDLIFDKNINADLEDDWGHTPLFYAIENRNKKAINELKSGMREYNLNALLSAIETDDILLIKYFFKFQLKKDEGQIMPALGANVKNTEILKLFLSNGLDINASNEKQETALFLAIRNKNIDTAKFLISQNADVNCITKDQYTLWEFLDWKNEDIINIIISTGKVDPELQNGRGLTPLFYAIFYKHMQTVKSLLSSHNLDVNKKTKLIDYIEFKRNKVWKLLKQGGFPKTSNALKQIGKNFLSYANSFLTKLEDLHVRLHFAVFLGNMDEVENIIQTIDLESVDKYNSILPLHFGVKGKLLDKTLLMKNTKWIFNIYKKKYMWTIEDVREYVLKK